MNISFERKLAYFKREHQTNHLKSLFMKCFNFCCCIGTKRTYHAETKNLVFYVSIFYFSVFYGLFFMLSSAASFTWLLITVHIDESSIYAYVLVKRIVRFVSYSHVRPQQCSVCVFTPPV
ncbi:hypothetical protein T09_1815 [Trichinella sp. T9]|nr:hypothetical protein T09_1815 [Trichinella sp. T9]